MSTCPACGNEIIVVGVQHYPARLIALKPSLKHRVLVHCDNPECPMYEATCTEGEIFSNWQKFGSPLLMRSGGGCISSVTTAVMDCVFCDSPQSHDVRTVTIEGIDTQRVKCLKCEAVSTQAPKIVH